MAKENLMACDRNNLKLYRTMRYMAQEDLAEKVCANIERGKTGVSMSVLRDFEDAPDITVNQLLYDRKANQHIDNIVVLLQDKSTACLSCLEQTTSIPDDAFSKSR